MEMEQSNLEEIKALKDTVSRLAVSIKDADPEKREGLRSEVVVGFNRGTHGLFSGGHLHGQLLILIIRGALGTL